MQYKVQLQLNNSGSGIFYINDGVDQIAKMEVGITGKLLTVYHTEVAEKEEGKGLAKTLLAVMVDHARTHNLKVLPLCPYVHLQFKRHPEDYGDIWQRETNHQ